MGKSALAGLDGISKITRGFKGFKEINTVYYDPARIHIETMIDALKAAGTFRGIAD